MILFQGDDDIPLFVSRVDIAVRFDHSFQGIAAVDDHMDPARLDQLFDEDQWTDWFEGLTVTLEENGDTLLTGMVIDQAALYGLLKRIRDLGMPLLSVNSVGIPSEDTPGTKDPQVGTS